MCQKIAYRTEHAAQVALVSAVIGRNRGRAQRHERRYYRCEKCGFFHLTSQPYRQETA